MMKMWLDRALSEDFSDILIVSEETPTLGCQTYLFCFWTWTFEFAFAFGFFENLLNLLLLLAPQTYISKANSPPQYIRTEIKKLAVGYRDYFF